MLRRLLTASLVAFACVAVSNGEEPAKAKPAANSNFEKMKKLVGTWVEADKDGKPTDKVVSVIKLTAGGSAIQETNFPGQAMEMMSLYHMDKDDFIMTHYCILGNQPKMKADPKAAANTIKWDFVGGTNLDPAKDTHMHAAVVTIIDDDHIEMAGEAWEGGKKSDTHCAMMKLVRKK